MSKEKILDRVVKMLALANDDAATDGERDNALRMAYNILAKHQLSLADVNERQREQEDPREQAEAQGLSYPFARHVRYSVCQLFMVLVYGWTKVNQAQRVYKYVGRASNVSVAMYMSDYVIRSIKREATRRYKHDLTPEARSFCVGAAAELGARIEKMIADKQAELRETGNALALVDIEKAESTANEAFVASSGVSLRTTKARRSQVVTDAYNRGKDYGSAINLSLQVGNRPNTLRIK